MADDKIRRYGKSSRNFQHHDLAGAFARDRSALAYALKPVGSIRKIGQNMHLFTRVKIKSRNLNAGYYGDTITFSDDLPSYCAAAEAGGVSVRL